MPAELETPCLLAVQLGWDRPARMEGTFSGNNCTTASEPDHACSVRVCGIPARSRLRCGCRYRAGTRFHLVPTRHRYGAGTGLPNCKSNAAARALARGRFDKPALTAEPLRPACKCPGALSAPRRARPTISGTHIRTPRRTILVCLLEHVRRMIRVDPARFPPVSLKTQNVRAQALCQAPAQISGVEFSPPGWMAANQDRAIEEKD